MHRVLQGLANFRSLECLGLTLRTSELGSLYTAINNIRSPNLQRLVIKELHQTEGLYMLEEIKAMDLDTILSSAAFARLDIVEWTVVRRGPFGEGEIREWIEEVRDRMPTLRDTGVLTCAIEQSQF